MCVFFGGLLKSLLGNYVFFVFFWGSKADPSRLWVKTDLIGAILGKITPFGSLK